MGQLKNGLYEKFAIEYLRTPDRTKAAEACGFTGLTAQLKGSRLLRVEAVKTRIKELQRELKGKAIADVEERMQRLTAILRHDPMPENVSGKERIMAVAELNKMDGSYAPERHAVLGKVQIEVVYRDKKELPPGDAGD